MAYGTIHNITHKLEHQILNSSVYEVLTTPMHGISKVNLKPILNHAGTQFQLQSPILSSMHASYLALGFHPHTVSLPSNYKYIHPKPCSTPISSSYSSMHENMQVFKSLANHACPFNGFMYTPLNSNICKKSSRY